MPLNTPNYGSSKSNDHRFKNLTFLKTRDKTTLNKKNHPATPSAPPIGGLGGGDFSLFDVVLYLVFKNVKFLKI